uniref:Xyloglucan endotransglucosylase/hydrolase n=1 Tax=Nelumbo nucifera TaxID=4432 RepID=A0A822XTX2_NELNU|nr:TPA_asm: hypothetical protein HUJ06_024646 [Nelumbo nucifera]
MHVPGRTITNEGTYALGVVPCLYVTQATRPFSFMYRIRMIVSIESRCFFYLKKWDDDDDDSCSFMVDETPVRVFTNKEKQGIPFPKDQAMGVYSSIWNADDWATQGGRVKTNWTNAPFIASYTGFEINACECPVTVAADENAKRCSSSEKKYWWDQPVMSELNLHQSHQLLWVRANHLVYDYCTDATRFPVAPPECDHHHRP